MYIIIYQALFFSLHTVCIIHKYSRNIFFHKRELSNSQIFPLWLKVSCHIQSSNKQYYTCLLIVKYSWGNASLAHVHESLTILSVFGTGNAGSPGNNRSKDFSAPSQDRSKRPISHHMIQPISYSIIAKLMPFLFFCPDLFFFFINWA